LKSSEIWNSYKYRQQHENTENYKYQISVPKNQKLGACDLQILYTGVTNSVGLFCVIFCNNFAMCPYYLTHYCSAVQYQDYNDPDSSQSNC